MAIQKIYRDFFNQQVFTAEDLKKKYKHRNTWGSLKVLLHQGKIHGYIGSIKRGLYYVIPQGLSKEEHRVDKYLVANKFGPATVIVYHSALELHGVAQSVFNRVYMLTSRRVSGMNFQGTEFVPVSGHAGFGQATITREGIPIHVTDRERTLIDCLDRLRYAGGLEEYLKSIEGFPSVDFSRIEEYLKKYKKISLYSKVGFLLSFFEPKWSFPQDVRRRLQKRIRKKVYYLNSSRQDNTFNKEWNIMVPKNLIELINPH